MGGRGQGIWRTVTSALLPKKTLRSLGASGEGEDFPQGKGVRRPFQEQVMLGYEEEEGEVGKRRAEWG